MPKILCALLALLMTTAAYAADPLGSFRALAEGCANAFNAFDEVTLGKDGKTYAQVKRDKGRVSFDVRKTDSLVSPFMAYIEVAYLDKLSFGRSPEAARKKMDLITDNTYRITYALQDDKWVMRDVTRAWRFPTIDVSKGAKAVKFAELVEAVPTAIACDPAPRP